MCSKSVTTRNVLSAIWKLCRCRTTRTTVQQTRPSLINRNSINIEKNERTLITREAKEQENIHTPSSALNRQHHGTKDFRRHKHGIIRSFVAIRLNATIDHILGIQKRSRAFQQFCTRLRACKSKQVARDRLLEKHGSLSPRQPGFYSRTLQVFEEKRNIIRPQEAWIIKAHEANLTRRTFNFLSRTFLLMFPLVRRLRPI